MSAAPISFDPERLEANAPECLRERPQWVAWAYADRGGKRTKCPINPKRGGLASATDPATWSNFERAVHAAEKASLDGVGYVLSAEDPFTGVDMDRCVDPVTRKPKPWAAAFLHSLDSYSEVSPSGTGVKVFVRASKAGPRCKASVQDGAIEIYDRERFFTLTGASLSEPPKPVADGQSALDAVYAEVFGTVIDDAGTELVVQTVGPVLDDEEILRLARSRKGSGEKFAALWAGQWNDHFNSRSEADSSVIFTLAWYTKDPVQLDRLFRRSALMRNKWDAQHGATTYGMLTITKALAKVSGQYDAGAARKLIAPPHSDRVQIQSNERQLRDIRVDALAALQARNDPPRLFHRGGGIARIVLQQENGEATAPSVQQLDPDALRGELADAADWFTLRHGKNDDFLVPDLPPLPIAKDLLSQPSVDLPPLIGLVTCPTFTSDGTLVVEDGYHPSGLWHHRTIEELAPVEHAPSPTAIAQARELLLGIFTDFPFVDDASRAHALAVTLLPFARQLIQGPTPLHAVDAPSPATGKDLLVKAALLPGLGYEVGATTAAKDGDEWRKKITAALVGDTQAILWGNIARQLDSEHLAAVLTDTCWRDRQLGHSRELQLPNRAVWTATGNNLSFSRELTRRVVWIRLDARLESPEQRTGFTYSNLLGHVRSHRGVYVHAALTLVRAWLAAGRPPGTQVMGSFEEYVRVMGGILSVAGVDGFLANAQDLRERSDVETSDWRAFVTAWWERWHDAPVGVSDLAGLLWDDEENRTDLFATLITANTRRGALTQLGMRLSRKRDCIVAGYRIHGGQADKSGRQQYQLVPVDGIPLGEKGQGMPKVCPKVCQQNSSEDNDLQTSAYLGIPFSQPLRTRTGTRAPAHACAREDGPPKRYAKVCRTPEVLESTVVSAAYLAADLGHTSVPGVERYADAFPTTSEPAWYVGDDPDVPRDVAALARRQDGWQPRAWRDRLVQLANRCEETNPDRAAELRQAAALLSDAPKPDMSGHVEPRSAPTPPNANVGDLGERT